MKKRNSAFVIGMAVLLSTSFSVQAANDDDKKISKALSKLISRTCDTAQYPEFTGYFDCISGYAQGYTPVELVDILDDKIVKEIDEAYSATYKDICLTAASDAAKATFDNTSADWYITYTQSAMQCINYEQNNLNEVDALKSIVEMVYQP